MEEQKNVNINGAENESAETEAENAEKKEAAKLAKLLDPEEQIRQFGRGRMELRVPIQDGENVCKVLNWDFLALTGAEYVDALDRDTRANNTFRISNLQALSLFAAAAAKATPGVDATDIRRGLGIMDAQKATQVATVFFTASSRAGHRNISNE